MSLDYDYGRKHKTRQYSSHSLHAKTTFTLDTLPFALHTLFMWSKLAWVALAGALGTVARYSLGGLVHRILPQNFPWGTLAVNCLGCFLFGLIWPLIETRHVLPEQMRPVILVGFMGAFTTYSTFAFETSEQLRDTEWLIAGANLSAHVILGIGLYFLGGAVSRAF